MGEEVMTDKKIMSISADMKGEGDSRKAEISLSLTFKSNKVCQGFIDDIRKEFLKDNRLNHSKLINPYVTYINVRVGDEEGKLCLFGKVSIGNGHFVDYCINNYMTYQQFMDAILSEEPITI
jgi:hypothetical protein